MEDYRDYVLKAISLMREIQTTHGKKRKHRISSLKKILNTCSSQSSVISKNSELLPSYMMSFYICYKSLSDIREKKNPLYFPINEKRFEGLNIDDLYVKNTDYMTDYDSIHKRILYKKKNKYYNEEGREVLEDSCEYFLFTVFINLKLENPDITKTRENGWYLNKMNYNGDFISIYPGYVKLTVFQEYDDENGEMIKKIMVIPSDIFLNSLP